MKVTNWFLNFDFRTRARRSHMWANWFSWFGVAVVLLIALSATTPKGAAPATAAFAIVALAGTLLWVLSFIDGVAMTFRRAHDTGRSGWIWLLLLVPLINLLPLYWLLIEDSQQGPNKYGPPVKAFYVAPVAA